MSAAIDTALKAAMQGPEVKDLRVFGHNWNIKKATVTKSANTITVKGQISHNVALTQDDQIHYQFVFKKDKLVQHRVKIAEGGWASLMGKFLSFATGGVVDADDIESVANKVENFAHGTWKSGGHQLAFRIALEGYRRKSRAAVPA